MTDLPPVVCPSCGASYRHPGRAGRTKCKACGAPMVITMPGEAAAAPVVEPKAAGVAARPTVKPVSSGSPAAAKPKPVPPRAGGPARPKPPVVAPQAEDAPAEAPEPADTPSASRGTVSRERQRPGARARRPTTGGSSRRQQGAAAEAQGKKAAPRRGSRGSSRRGMSTSGRPTTVVIPESEIPIPRKKGPNAALLASCGIGVLVLLVGLLWWALFDDEKPAGTGDGATKTASTAGGGTKGSSEKEDLTDSLVTGGETTDPAASSDESEGGKTGEGESKPARKEPEKKPKKPKNKFEKRWNDLPDFEVVEGTTDEQAGQIRNLLTEAMDPTAGAASYRAQDKIIAFGRTAIPLVINEFLKLDMDGDQAEVGKGQVLNELLREITKITDRFYDPTEGGQEAGYYRSLTRYYWHRWWKKVKDTWTGPVVSDDEEEDG